MRSILWNPHASAARTRTSMVPMSILIWGMNTLNCGGSAGEGIAEQ